MTLTELRQTEQYRSCMDQIREYSFGYKFTLPFYKMGPKQSEAVHQILQDAYAEGLIECISFDFDRDGVITEETWRRI